MTKNEKNNESKRALRQLKERLIVLIEALLYIKNHTSQAASILRLAAGRLFGTGKRVFLLGSPTHGNRGDQMIVFAMEKWCGEYLKEYIYTEYDSRFLTDMTFLSLLKAAVRKRDVILIRGGGSVGDWYIGYEYFVRFVIKRFPRNKIVTFPQSVNFSDTPKGREEKRLTALSYDSHPDFTLYTRDITSFAIAGEMFSRAKVRLCPDIAMFLFYRYPVDAQPRNGVLFCLRTDKKEIYYTEKQRKHLVDEVGKKYDLLFGDTEAGHIIYPETRESEIRQLLGLFTRSKVAVTDRFHGVIAAVLTNTPCVALRSADHKISSGIKWFENTPSVFFAESIEEAPFLIDKAMRCDKIAAPDFEPYFRGIREEIVNG